MIILCRVIIIVFKKQDNAFTILYHKMEENMLNLVTFKNNDTEVTLYSFSNTWTLELETFRPREKRIVTNLKNFDMALHHLPYELRNKLLENPSDLKIIREVSHD